ncbi:MAG TPA: hypothetical protein VH189_16220 [Rhizomicrobium sp.]|nr:hypothetical protein [Rhizomicrobium sp.]
MRLCVGSRFMLRAVIFLAASLIGHHANAAGFAKDYSNVRGFNYTPASARGYTAEWQDYKHAEADRDMAYAQRLRLNMARVFLSYNAWLADKAAFKSHIQDFVRTANARGIGTMFVLVDLPQGMMKDLFEESAKPQLRAWAKDIVDAAGREPGLAMWDATNEPDLVRMPAFMPNTNQPQRIAVARFMAQVLHELDHHTPVTIGCLYLDCTQQTADVVDVLSYHDYSMTRAQMAADISRAQQLAVSVKKPIMTTEMGCTGRANPYDVEIEEHDKAHMGWIVWELMIAHNWGPIHGVFYPDGTVRDPAIAAAIVGVFRNRSSEVVLEEPDREGLMSGALEDAQKWLHNPNPDWFDGLVVAETEANFLEANQLVGLRELPTRRVEMLRAGNDMAGLRKAIQEFTLDLLPFITPGKQPAHRYYTPKVVRAAKAP